MLAMSIVRYFSEAKPSKVFISVANEEKEKTVKSMDSTRNEVRNVKSQSEKENLLDLETESAPEIDTRTESKNWRKKT